MEGYWPNIKREGAGHAARVQSLQLDPTAMWNELK